MSNKCRFPPATLEEMIPHDQLVERYPWISPHSLARWRREKRLRAYHGKGGVLVYPRSDIERALADEMDRDQEARRLEAEAEAIAARHAAELRKKPKTYTDSPEAIEIRERLFRNSLTQPRKKKSEETPVKPSRKNPRKPVDPA